MNERHASASPPASLGVQFLNDLHVGLARRFHQVSADNRYCESAFLFQLNRLRGYGATAPSMSLFPIVLHSDYDPYKQTALPCYTVILISI